MVAYAPRNVLGQSAGPTGMASRWPDELSLSAAAAVGNRTIYDATAQSAESAGSYDEIDRAIPIRARHRFASSGFGPFPAFSGSSSQAQTALLPDSTTQSSTA